MTTVNESYIRWIRSSIDELIQTARVALEDFAADPSQIAQMQSCHASLGQIHGSLKMVELYGVALLAEEMEALALALLEQRVGKPAEACEALMTGLVRLPDRLDRIQQGAEDSPMGLLNLVNDLRVCRNAPLETGLALFGQELEQRLQEHYISGGQPNPAMPKIAEKLRESYVKGLLHWIRNPGTQDGIKLVLGVVDRFVQYAGTDQVKYFFQALGAVAVSLANDQLQAGAALKKLLARIDREFKQIVAGGEQAFIDDPEPELFKNILYYVAQSSSQDPRVLEVRQRFALEPLHLDDDSAEVGGLNQELVATITAAVKEDLLSIKDEFNRYSKSGGDAASLQSMGEQINRLADTIGMLGLGSQRLLLKKDAEQIQTWLEQGQLPEENALMDVAASMVQLEISLDNLNLGGAARTTSQSPALDDLMAATLGETTVEMAHIKETLGLYLEHPENGLPEHLNGRFSIVLGALSILQMQELSAMLSLTRDYVGKRLGGAELPPKPELETLADLVAAVEFFMESVAQNQGMEGRIIEFARDAQQRLQTIIDSLAAAPEPSEPLTAEADLDLDMDLTDLESALDLADEGLADEEARPLAESEPEPEAEVVEEISLVEVEAEPEISLEMPEAEVAEETITLAEVEPEPEPEIELNLELEPVVEEAEPELSLELATADAEELALAEPEAEAELEPEFEEEISLEGIEAEPEISLELPTAEEEISLELG
ncbi:MAG: hypothetical protein HQL47_10210, partial [Gammaproteobacteria bacterium]|nr:hypothetical protein [Gammaproteobacteria bacterium]